MKAAIYCRVSTDEQADNGTSLGTQKEQARAYIVSRSWELVAEFEDPGVSGTKDESGRPGLRALMQAARSEEIEVVVVTKLDRFFRSQRHFVRTVGELDDLGVKFVSVSEGFDSTTLTGKLMRNILSSFADFEHGRITERMMEGKRAVTKQGFWAGGCVPFGFRPIEEGAHKRLVVDEFNAETIRIAASLLVDAGRSTNEVAQHLNALERLTALGKRWDIALIRYTLRREALLPGVLTEEGILTQETFDAVQVALERKAHPSRRRDYVYPLSLRLFGTCGAPYRGVFRKDTGRRYYTCKNSDWEQREVKCDDRALQAEDIETVVWEEVVGVLANPQRLLVLAEDYLGLKGVQAEFERDSVADLDAKITAQEKVLTDNVAQAVKAGLSAQVIQSVTAQLTEELDALRRHREMLTQWREESQQQSERMKRLWDLSSQADANLKNMGPEGMKEVLALLDVRVHILDHGERTAGHRILRPAKVKVEGFVTDSTLTQAVTREMKNDFHRRGSARARAAAVSPPGAHGRR